MDKNLNKGANMKAIHGDNNKHIAETIMDQLGGNRFIAMTGCKRPFVILNGVQFKIGRNSSRCNTIKITLDVSDTYTMEFLYVSVKGVKELETVSGIYNDALQGCFTNFTGLYTSF